jgi:hypothetical protein
VKDILLENFTLEGKIFCLALGVYTKIIIGAKQHSDHPREKFTKLFLKINEIILGGMKNTLYICKRNKGRKKNKKNLTYFWWNKKTFILLQNN